MAEGRGGSELRLHVQAAHHRKQFRRKNEVNIIYLTLVSPFFFTRLML